MLRSAFKLLLPVLAGSLLLSSCSSSKSATVASRESVKGGWLLSDITYEGIASGEKLKITLLDEGSETCLKGSSWVFPNNGYGSYTINSSATGCAPGEKSIYWAYRKEGDQAILQYKKLIEGVKAKDVADGYKLRIVSAAKTSMVLQSEVTYQGSSIRINYIFSKN